MIVTVCHYTLAVYHDKIALSWFCQMEIAVPFAQALHIDRNRSQPLYRQIAEQIRVQIGEGHLPPGTQLPTVRQLAEIVGVTRVTAQNAYGELQAVCWIEAIGVRGIIVTTAQTKLDSLN